jgi:hypothetical protein
LDGAELTDPLGYSRIPKDCRSRDARCDLFEQLQVFPARAPYSALVKPVVLPPGSAKLST